MSDPPGMPPNPYVGPRAFTRKDTLFGRDVETVNLLNMLISERIVLLYSPSGAGKTSLIQAGVVPALEAEHFRPLPVIRVNRDVEIPHPNPSPVGPGEGLTAPVNRYVASALHSLAEGLPGRAATDLAGLTLSEYLDRLDGGEEPPAGEISDPMVLIFDQFEEILTVEPADLAVKDAFFVQVGEALRARHRWALFAMREEYVAALDPWLRHIPTRLATTFRLGLLEPPAAREAIQKPAAQAGVDFTAAAASRLIDELVAVRVQLPDGTTNEESLPFVEPVQLQVVCTRFWERLPWPQMPLRDNRRQIEESYVAELAQVDDALGDYYAAKIATIATASKRDAPHVLERQIREWIDANLITERGTRAQLRVGAEREQTLPDEVVQALVDAYLIRREGRPGDRWYELAHDRLVQPIAESNSAWLRAHLAPVQLRARQWDETGRRRESLPRGADLARARGWITANASALPVWEQALLTDFLGDGVREQRARTSRAVLIGGAVAGVLVMVLAGFYVNFLSNQRVAEARNRVINEALIRERNVTQANLLASQAEANLQTGNLDLALLLAAEGAQTSNTLESRRRLLQALRSRPGLEAYLGRQASAPAVVAVSPDGKTAVSAGCAGDAFPCLLSEMLLWDLDTRRALGALEHADGGAEVLSLAFSPDNRTIAAGTADDGVVLWDVETRAPLGDPFEGTERAVSSVAFSHDGETLAAGSPGGTIVLWNLTTRQPRGAALTGHLGHVTSLSFAPNGTLASGGRDGAVLVWDGAELRLRCEAVGDALADCVVIEPAGTPAAGIRAGAEAGSGGQTVARPALTGPIQSLSFSPDGRRLAAGTGNGAVSVWDAATGRRQTQLPNQDVGVLSVAFSPDGSTLAVVAQNRGMSRWNLDTGDPTIRIQASGDFSAVAFGPDGTRFVAGAASADVLLWDLERAIPLARRFTAASAVSSVAITRDGRTLAAGTADGIVEVWDVGAGDRIWAPADAVSPITSMLLGPDGRTIVAGSQDGLIHRWEIGSDRAPIQFAGGLGAVNGLAMSADEQTLVSGSADGVARVWDLARPAAAPTVLPGDGGAVGAVAFSPNGEMLAAGRADGTVELFASSDYAAAPRVLESNQSQIFSMTFNPRHAATLAASGRAVVLLDTASGERAGSLPSRSNEPIYAIAFSPDGTTLAMASADGNIYLWDIATNLELGALAGHDGPVRGLSFAGNGDLVSGSEDATVLVWSVSPESLIERACRIANRNLSREEWEEFILDQSYRATCPAIPLEGTPPSETDTGATPAAATP